MTGEKIRKGNSHNPLPPSESNSFNRIGVDSKSDLTRRQWLLRWGETALLVGIQGVAGKARVAATVAALPSTNPPGKALPEGLYEAANDHLVHALTAVGRFRPIPPGSPIDFVLPHERPFEPQFFSGEEFKALGRLLELILGEDRSKGTPEMSSTIPEILEWIDLTVYSSMGIREALRNLSPQHRALAIAYHGPEAVHQQERDDPEREWRQGLAWLSAESRKRYGRSFLEVNEFEQRDLVRFISDDSASETVARQGTHLFALIKSAAIRGFYTSQHGLQELDYKGNTFYGECPGCPDPDHP